MQSTGVRRLCLDAGAAGLLGLVLALVIGIDWMTSESERFQDGRPGKGRVNLLAPSSPYALRVAENKEEWIAEYGGTKESELAVAAGLNWLVRHQGKDGSWCPSYLFVHPAGVCEETGPCRGGGQDYPFAQTGLAVLALQAAGNFEFNDARYSEAWCVAVCIGLPTIRPTMGCSAAEGTTRHVYEHGIAAFALAESCAAARAFGKPPDKQILAAATKAINHIEKYQHDDGGWRDTESNARGQRYVGQRLAGLALKSAHGADIPFSDECTRKVKYFFQRCELGDHGRTGYQPGRPMTHATTGVGMLVHQFLLNDPDADLVHQAAPYLADQAENLWGRRDPGRRGLADYYLWYNCTLAMCTAGGEPWKCWNAVVRDLVMSRQERPDAGCARGSWPPTDQWALKAGAFTRRPWPCSPWKFITVLPKSSRLDPHVFKECPVMQSTQLNRLYVDAGAAGLLGLVLALVIGVDWMTARPG